jgi:hypothetical protein
VLKDWPNTTKEEKRFAWLDDKYKMTDLESLATTSPASLEHLKTTARESSKKIKEGKGTYLLINCYD